MSDKKRVFGYVRVSTEAQMENTSLDVQRERITAYCISQGWELVCIFEDGGLSGSNTARPQYQDMLTQLDDCDLILTFKLDRISRNLKDILILIEDYLTPEDVGIKSVSEPFDSSTPEGKLMLQMLGGFAEFERKRITERLMSGKYHNASHGGDNGFPSPYGYERTPDGERDFEIIEAEAKIIKKVFGLYSKGHHSIRKLIKETGCPLSPPAVLAMIKNPFYIGLIDYDGKVEKNNHEPIISDRMFKAAQKVTLARSKAVQVLSHKDLEQNIVKLESTNITEQEEK